LGRGDGRLQHAQPIGTRTCPGRDIAPRHRRPMYVCRA
jgi:hypothetical protein